MNKMKWVHTFAVCISVESQKLCLVFGICDFLLAVDHILYMHRSDCTSFLPFDPF